jgi:hypothetical protein
VAIHPAAANLPAAAIHLAAVNLPVVVGVHPVAHLRAVTARPPAAAAMARLPLAATARRRPAHLLMEAASRRPHINPARRWSARADQASKQRSRSRLVGTR